MTEPPPIGDNSRRADISRTAEELRAKFISETVKHDTPFELKAISLAWASDMNDRDFRQFTGHVIYSKSNVAHEERSHEVIAMLSGTSVRSSERSDAKLKKEKWLSSQKLSTGNIIRKISIPPVIAEALERASMNHTQPPPMAVGILDVVPPPMAVGKKPTATHGGRPPTQPPPMAVANRHPWREAPHPTATHGGCYSSSMLGDDEGAGRREKATASRDSQDTTSSAAEQSPVYVNGVGIRTPWFLIDNEMIRVAGETNSIPKDKRNVLAELIARRWVSQNRKPDFPMDALSRAMARQRLHLQTDEAKIRIELENLQKEQSNPQQMRLRQGKDALSKPVSDPGQESVRAMMRQIKNREQQR
jgi:hypothetical protein